MIRKRHGESPQTNSISKEASNDLKPINEENIIAAASPSRSGCYRRDKRLSTEK